MSDQSMIQTMGGPWRKFRTVNCTDSSFDSIIPTATEPTGTGSSATNVGLIDLIGNIKESASIQNGICLCFFGAGSDTQTFSVRGIGWSRVGSSPALTVSDSTEIWIPVPLFEVSVALSIQTGLAGKAVINTDLFCDTITLTGTTANAGVNCNIVSPANDTIAYMYVDLTGHQKFELIFDMTGATSGNALYKTY